MNETASAAVYQSGSRTALCVYCGLHRDTTVILREHAQEMRVRFLFISLAWHRERSLGCVHAVRRAKIEGISVKCRLTFWKAPARLRPEGTDDGPTSNSGKYPASLGTIGMILPVGMIKSSPAWHSSRAPPPDFMSLLLSSSDPTLISLRIDNAGGGCPRKPVTPRAGLDTNAPAKLNADTLASKSPSLAARH
jgi:hypothetical protein